MSALGTEALPLRIAVVGSGPSGFYAAEALLQSGLHVDVDVIERLPVPFGLVRYGVAPDHPKLKEVTQVFSRIASHERFRLIGNVRVGADVTFDDLARCYHAVVMATGASQDRALDIPGEALCGVHSATDFVGWYNGHPSCVDLQFDLSGEAAVVVGNGNVALDVCRILAAPVDKLRQTDIADHALDVLAASRIREIHLVGRRGPVQARFTHKELREFGHLEGCRVHVEPRDLELTPTCLEEVRHPLSDAAAKNLELLRAYAAAVDDGAASRHLHIDFCLAPLALLGDGRVRAVKLARTTLVGPAFSQDAQFTDEHVLLDAGIVLRSVGYRSEPVAGLPFDQRRGTIPHVDGRVAGDSRLPSYVTGWIKRGPSGVIGSNRADSVETIAALLADVPSWSPTPRDGHTRLLEILSARGVRTTDWVDWLRIDAVERSRGKPAGRPRSKLVRIEEMLDIAA